MSIISAGTTTTTALVETGDTTGNLVLQVNGTTPSLTLNTAGAHGVGSSPSYGTTGQFLTSQGSAASPTWTSVSIPSSAMTLISTQTANNTSPYLQWTGLSGYDKYHLVFNNILHTGFHTSAQPNLQLGTGATPTWITSSYQFYNSCTYNGNTFTGFNSSGSSWIIGGQYIGQVNGSGAGYTPGIIGTIEIAGCSGTTSLQSFNGTTQTYNATTAGYEIDTSTGSLNRQHK